MFSYIDLRTYARRGDYIKLSNLLEHTPDDFNIDMIISGQSPLFHALEGLPFSEGHVKCIVLLLERGANPYVDQRANEKSIFHTNPFFQALNKHDLSTIRAMLLSAPDYETKVEHLSAETKLTGTESVSIIYQNEVENGLDRELEIWVQKTAADSRRIHTLELEASADIKSSNFSEAVRAYEEIANLYAEHAEIELKLSMQPYDFSTFKFTEIYQNHYLAKQRQYLAEAFKLYQRIDHDLSKAFSPSVARAGQHKIVLERMIEIGKIMGIDKKKIRYYNTRYSEIKISKTYTGISADPAIDLHDETIAIHSDSDRSSDESSSLLSNHSVRTHNTALSFGQKFTRWLVGSDSETKPT